MVIIAVGGAVDKLYHMQTKLSLLFTSCFHSDTKVFLREETLIVLKAFFFFWKTFSPVLKGICLYPTAEESRLSLIISPVG